MSNDNEQTRAQKPLGTVDADKNYRKLGQPADTVSGTTQELFEVRGPGGDSDAASMVFKIIAGVAIVALVLAIVASQMGLIQ